MATIDVDLHVVLEERAGLGTVGRVLRWPLAWRVLLDDPDLASDPAAAAQRVTRYLVEPLMDTATDHLRRKDPLELLQALTAQAPQVVSVTCTLPTGEDNVFYRQPLTMRLPVLWWTHDPETIALVVPVLHLGGIVRRVEDIAGRVEREVRAYVARERVGADLLHLWRIASSQSVRVITERHPLRVDPPAKQFESRADNDQVAKEIDQVATQLASAAVPPVYELTDQITAVARVLTAPRPGSVLLVGPSGVGKTATVHGLLGAAVRWGLDHRPWYAISGSRLVAGMTGFGEWQARCQRVFTAFKQRQAVLHLGGLWEWLQVGRSSHQQQSIAGFLRPWLERGDLLAVAECTPGERDAIEREDPALLRCFTVITCDEPNAERTRLVLQQHATRLALQHLDLAKAGIDAAIEDGAIATIESLHRRFAAYSALPGRALRFLDQCVRGQADAWPVLTSDIVAAFTRETGLPRLLIDDAVRLDVSACRAFFSDRILGQDAAITAIVELITTIKADLARGDKPLASLLFIGPTGVGKTALAKALAQFCYGDPQRMARLDMSEFADPIAAARLIGTGGQSAGLLTERVRQQPFGVVLLDEIEKAHPAVFDLLLQVLGEGRLTDRAGRLARFQSSIVIMTSNIGVESLGDAALGFTATADDGQRVRQHFLDALHDHFRPEFINRIDRVVPFAPLDAETIRLVAEREIDLIRHRDGIRQRQATLEVSPSAMRWLAERGHDPRYGARSLKRRIEHDLLAPVTQALAARAGATPVAITVDHPEDTPDDGGVTVRLRDLGTDGPDPRADHGVIDRVLDLRRRAHRLWDGAGVQHLRNECTRLHWQRRTLEAEKGGGYRQREARQRLLVLHARLARLDPAIAAAQTYLADVTATEDALASAWYAREPLPRDAVTRLAALKTAWSGLLERLYAERFQEPDLANLVLYGGHYPSTHRLLRWWAAVADLAEHRLTVRAFRLADYDGERLGGANRQPVSEYAARILHPDDLASWLGSGGGDTLIVGVRFEGHLAAPFWQAEMGVHVFKHQRLTHQVLCGGSDDSLTEIPPNGAHTPAIITGTEPRRRRYQPRDHTMHDDRLKRDHHGPSDAWPAVLAAWQRAVMWQHIERELG